MLRWWERLSRSYVRAGAMAILGASAGGQYAHFVGCRTGSCPLTASIWRAGIFGVLTGAIVGWPVRASLPAAKTAPTGPRCGP